MHGIRRVFVHHLSAGILTARRKGGKGDKDAGSPADATSTWLREQQGVFITTLIAMLQHRAAVYKVGCAVLRCTVLNSACCAVLDSD